MAEKQTLQSRIGPGYQTGLLTVESDSGERKNGYIVWNCRCFCGNTVKVDMRTLRRGTAVDCGCMARTGPYPWNIAGLRFGILTALFCTGRTDGGGSDIWRLRCDCGNEIDVSLRELSAGRRRSCGCLSHPETEKYVGKQFGQLTVTGYAGKWDGLHHWNCRCSCGNELVVNQSNLRTGHTKSCGCLFTKRQRESMKLVKGTSVTFLESRRGRVNANNTSGHAGVYQMQRTGLWYAQIGFKGERYFLGTYQNKDDAIKARVRAEKVYDDFIDWYYSECLPSVKKGAEEADSMPAARDQAI